MNARTARHAGKLIAAAALLAVAIVGASSAALAAGPKFVEITEHAAECPTLDLLLTSSTTGVIRARRCDHCPLLTLDVDERTLVLRQGSSVALTEADNNRDRGATVMFDPETRRVTRILLRQ